MQKHTCAVHGCNHMVSIALFVCWACYSRVSREPRKSMDDARAALSFGYGAVALERYRSTKDQVIAAAQLEHDVRQRKQAA